MTVLVRTVGTRGRGVRADALAVRAERMLVALGRRESELSILLCDDATMRALNRRWRGIDRPTDVLAFPLSEAPGPTEPLGDVVISVDTARRQARQLDRPIASRAVFLLAHGILHLLGFDHRDRDEERRMTALTDGLVAAARGRRKPWENAVENPRRPARRRGPGPR